jgi:ubiquinone biosynthesis protein
MTNDSVSLTSTVRSMPGLFRILRILARHGFIGAIRGEGHWPTPVQVREALEELGVVFLKFGQILAVRRDLIPAEYVEELEHLHDRLPPLDFATVQSIVERELNGPLGSLFADFSAEPLAAATIAQVHCAMLADGRAVVVKVRRPGIELAALRDTAVLTSLAAIAVQLSPRLAAVDPVGMVQEFRESLTREMDFRLEARTIGRFRAALEDSEHIWIPDVVAERSNVAVLTLEHSDGERIDRYAESHPEARAQLAQSIAALILHQVFENGLFHADPHPGNVFVLPDGRLCLHDFGNVGELDDRMREGLGALLEATVDGESRDATDAYIELGLVDGDVDMAALERDIARLLRKIREQPLAEVSVGDALQSLVRIGGAHSVRNAGVILQLARAFVIAEAVMRELDPGLNVLTAFEHELQRVEEAHFSPARMLKSGKRVGRDLDRLVREAPGDLRRALRQMASGDLGTIRSPGAEAIGQRIGRDLERLTGATASAALAIAGALLATIGGWHRTVGDVLLIVGILGVVKMALGAWYVSWRTRRIR